MLDRLTEFKKIDAHSHVGYFGSWSDVGITPAELVEQMKEYQIEKTVISTYPMKESLEAAERYPDRLIGAAWVNPMEPDALTQIRNAVNNYGFRAIKLHPLSHSYLANDECVFPVAELAHELDIPLMIHTGHPPFSLPWSVGQLAELYPQVNIVQIHMGHGNGMYVQAAIDMAVKYPNLYLETSGMPMHTKIKEAYETVGSTRIMWGLDAPFHHPSVEIQRTLVSGLDDKALENIFYHNAARLLQL